MVDGIAAIKGNGLMVWEAIDARAGWPYHSVKVTGHSLDEEVLECKDAHF